MVVLSSVWRNKINIFKNPLSHNINTVSKAPDLAEKEHERRYKDKVADLTRNRFEKSR